MYAEYQFLAIASWAVLKLNFPEQTRLLSLFSILSFTLAPVVPS